MRWPTSVAHPPGSAPSDGAAWIVSLRARIHGTTGFESVGCARTGAAGRVPGAFTPASVFAITGVTTPAAATVRITGTSILLASLRRKVDFTAITSLEP